MSALARLSAEFSPDAPLEERFGSFWLEDSALDVRRMATALTARGARFISLTARPGEEGQARLSYHWDLDGQLFTVETQTRDGRIPSILPFCPAADWIEREVQEGYKVEFEDRPYEPLLLRPGDPLGVNLRSEEDE